MTNPFEYSASIARGDSFASRADGWTRAVCVASALIGDQWVLPETASHAEVTLMAEDLAPFLCAYAQL